MSSKFVDLTAIALCWPTRPLIADPGLGRSHRPRLGRRAVVDECRCSHGRAHTLRRELDDFEVPVPLCHSGCDPIPWAHRFARLRDRAVDTNMARRAGSRCGRASSENANRPKPDVDTYTGGHVPIVACEQLGGSGDGRPAAKRWKPLCIWPEPSAQGLHVRFRVHPHRPCRQYLLSRCISAPSDQGLAGQICYGIPTTPPKRRCRHCPLQILHPKASDLAGTANRVPHLVGPFSPSHPLSC